MRRRERARERQEKREDRRPILKKLRAALLRSLRGQHGDNMVCARGVVRPTAFFDPTQPGSGAAQPR